MINKILGNLIPPSFPFQVTTKNNQASVYWNSSLLQNSILNNIQVINGLANSNGNPNWFTFIPGNDLIWLEGIINPVGSAIGTPVVSSAKINSYGLGGTWGKGDLPGEYGSGHGPFEYQLTFDANGNSIFTQYLFRIQIFESTTSSVAPFPVSNIQLLNQNLIMQGDNYVGNLFTTADGPAGIGIIMPKPFAGPYIST